MNEHEPFQPQDLDHLAGLLHSADRVVPMHDVHRGDTGPRVIGLRHDVDDNPGSLDTALLFARWEFDHGFSSSYYLLHDSYYWGDDMLDTAAELEQLGHEVGIHVNAIAEALRTGRQPAHILRDALNHLRQAVRVVGCVAHGDPLCHRHGFVNDEMFSDSPRPKQGDPDRVLFRDGIRVQLDPVPRAVFGLEYDANWLSRGDYLSDSGGRWSQPFPQVAARYQAGENSGQLHMLIHPDWWGQAFPVRAAA